MFHLVGKGYYNQIRYTFDTPTLNMQDQYFTKL